MAQRLTSSKRRLAGAGVACIIAGAALASSHVAVQRCARVWCTASGVRGHRRLRSCCRAEVPGALGVTITWRTACNEARALEQRLSAMQADCSRAAQELDKFCAGGDPIKSGAYRKADKEEPMLAPWGPVAALLGMLGVAAVPGSRGPESPPKMSDVPTSVLGGTWEGCAPLQGRASSGFAAALPPLSSLEDLRARVTEDTSVTQEESALWRESFDLLYEDWPCKHARAEAALSVVRDAEVRADQRRRAAVAAFRGRVLDQMIRADGGASSTEELEAAIEAMQSGEIFARSLALLERLTLEAEDLQVELRRREGECARAPSSARFACREAVRQLTADLAERFEQIRRCYLPAMASPETLEQVRNVQKAMGKFNPFR